MAEGEFLPKMALLINAIWVRGKRFNWLPNDY